MPTKQELHKLIDELPDELTEGQFENVRQAIRLAKIYAETAQARPTSAPPPESVRELRDRLGAQRILVPDDGGPWLADFGDGTQTPVDSTLQAFYSAPLDDEPWTAEDEAASAEGRADRAAGHVAPWPEVEALLFGGA